MHLAMLDIIASFVVQKRKAHLREVARLAVTEGLFYARQGSRDMSLARRDMHLAVRSSKRLRVNCGSLLRKRSPPRAVCKANLP